MISTGNDIVALTDALIAKAATPRFYSKILSAEDKRLYDQSAIEHLSLGEYVWMQWSVKEAVYKLLKRLNRSLLFSPQKITANCPFQPTEDFQHCWTGSIHYHGHPIYSRTYYYTSHLHSIASFDKNFSNSIWGQDIISESDYASQSAGCRSLLFQQLEELMPGKKWVLSKTIEGVPILSDLLSDEQLPVSFSHDGQFVGFSVFVPISAR